MTRLIGLAGRAGAGKDTVSAFIKQHLAGKGLGVKLMSFAEPLKRICQEVYAFDDFQMTDRVLKEKGDPRYPRPDGTFLSPREAMQKCGTEFARSCYPNTWADLGIRRAKMLMKPDTFINPDAVGLSAVFTDCRFANEAWAIKQAGGQVWRIHRPEADTEGATHPSETEMDGRAFNELVDRRFWNNLGLEELRRMTMVALDE